MRTTRWDKLVRYWLETRTPPRLRSLIDRAQAETGVVLSWGARQMLIIPVVETLEAEGEIDWQQVERSIYDVIGTMAEDQPLEYRRNKIQTSISVIRAFFKRFCNIPPFCSRTEG